MISRSRFLDSTPPFTIAPREFQGSILLSTTVRRKELIPTCRDIGIFPFLTTDQMREVDRAMVDDYGIALIQMMENAGRNLAHLARLRFLESDPRGKRVIVLAGTGGNGGGAMVCARRLHGYGATVAVAASAPDDRYSGVPGHQLEILRRLGIAVESTPPLPRSANHDLIIDGVIGYSLQGPPREPAASMIRWANAADVPVLALDAPSGLDTTTGTNHDPAIRADVTMTLGLPKLGLQNRDAREYVGELYLADIGVPPELYAQPGLELDVGPIFSGSDIVRLW
jgi:NAD(P)H-hydrate epimerase